MQCKSSKYSYIPSKLYEPKNKNIPMKYGENNYKYNYKFEQHNNQKKKIIRPNSAYQNSQKLAPNINQEQNYTNEEINNYENNPKNSMFNEYYKEKLGYINNNEINKDNEENINEIDDNKPQFIEHENNKIPIKRPISSKVKSSTQRDFIEDNKHLISKIQNANNSNRLKEYINKKENPYHKEYGKTPKYIENMRLENEKKKEMDKIKKETAKYPKGTRLLSEEERVLTLEKLKQSKDDINKVIEKLPITCDTQAFRNKKDELFKKLDEIEKAIETFSKKKVFVKLED